MICRNNRWGSDWFGQGEMLAGASAARWTAWWTIAFRVLVRPTVFWLVVVGSIAACSAKCQAQDSVMAAAASATLVEHLYDLPSVAIAEATLRQPARFQLRRTPLSSALENIASSYRITVWLDRRIDPGYLVTFQATGAELQNALQQIARLANAEMQLVENVVYIGPAGSAGRLAAAAARLYDAMQRHGGPALKQPILPSWEALATPTELLQSAAKKGRLTIQERLPHDLLRGGQFQRPSAQATCLSLICVGHDQMCLLTGSQEARLAPLLSDERWAAEYPSSRMTAAQVQQLKRKLSSAEVRRVGEKWQVAGNAVVHRSFGHGAETAGGGSPGRRPPRGRHGSRTDGETRLSGDIAGTVENVAKQLAQMRGLTLNWAATCTDAQRQKNVRFHVENATFEQIVDSFAKAAGLQFELSEAEMSLVP